MTIRKVERAAPSLTKTLHAEVEAAQLAVRLATAKEGIYRFIESLFDNRNLSFVSKYNPKTGRIRFTSTVPTAVFENLCSRIERQVQLDNTMTPGKAQEGNVSPSVTAIFERIGDSTIEVRDFKSTSY